MLGGICCLGCGSRSDGAPRSPAGTTDGKVHCTTAVWSAGRSDSRAAGVLAEPFVRQKWRENFFEPESGFCFEEGQPLAERQHDRVG